MKNLYDISIIRQLERIAIGKLKVPEQELMERAGASSFKVLRKRWPDAKRIAVLCGKGNNGGDGYVLARLAKEKGLEVTVYQQCSTSELKGPALKAAKKAEKIGVLFKSAGFVGREDVIVDALLGIGISGEVQGEIKKTIDICNDSSSPVLAIDTPSGLDVDKGIVLGCAVKADVTVTYIGRKAGLFTGQGVAFAGEVICESLTLPKEAWKDVKPVAKLVCELPTFPKRAKDAHKGKYGHVLVIGGDQGMAGAVRMAGEAALRVGSGLVTVATRAEHIGVVAGQRPELMCKGILDADELDPLLSRASVIIVGPGLGESDWSKACFEKVLKADLPMVVDADGLNLLAENPRENPNWILTPHPGEAARLLDIETSDIQLDRLASTSQIEKKYSGICVLKGAGTIVKEANSLPVICQVGNPGMATGGMGDVLSGVIGGLLAQGQTLTKAAVNGVMLHGHAADLVAQQSGERGLIATDLMPVLQRLVN